MARSTSSRSSHDYGTTTSSGHRSSWSETSPEDFMQHDPFHATPHSSILSLPKQEPEPEEDYECSSPQKHARSKSVQVNPPRGNPYGSQYGVSEVYDRSYYQNPSSSSSHRRNLTYHGSYSRKASNEQFLRPPESSSTAFRPVQPDHPPSRIPVYTRPTQPRTTPPSSQPRTTPPSQTQTQTQPQPIPASPSASQTKPQTKPPLPTRWSGVTDDHSITLVPRTPPKQYAPHLSNRLKSTYTGPSDIYRGSERDIYRGSNSPSDIYRSTEKRLPALPGEKRISISPRDKKLSASPPKVPPSPSSKSDKSFYFFKTKEGSRKGKGRESSAEEHETSGGSRDEGERKERDEGKEGKPNGGRKETGIEENMKDKSWASKVWCFLRSR